MSITFLPVMTAYSQMEEDFLEQAQSLQSVESESDLYEMAGEMLKETLDGLEPKTTKFKIRMICKDGEWGDVNGDLELETKIARRE